MTAAQIHGQFIEIATGLSPALADVIARLEPVNLRADQSMPLDEYLCRVIAGQQLSVKVVRSIWARVEEAAGNAPLMDFFVDENSQRLRACGLSGAKIRALCGIAQQARAGRLQDEELRLLDHDQRTRRLTELWGVGQWTADMVSMFRFGDPDIWPDGDVAARNTLVRLTSRRRSTLRTAARFAPHRSYLALYMWNCADAAPVN